ncbi:MAG: hypothetical protein QCI38_05680, partial [Candidatus Thermoplasmatota archaeon]|nr:hypothetical protein [Candidatus Thermoplasmatota archaeon]
MKRVIVGLAVLAMAGILLLLMAPQSSAEAGWQEDVNLSQTDEDSYNPRVVVDSLDHIHVVWHDNSQIGGIFYKEYNSNSWSETTIINSGALKWGHNPTITVDPQDNVHVAFVSQKP